MNNLKYGSVVRILSETGIAYGALNFLPLIQTEYTVGFQFFTAVAMMTIIFWDMGRRWRCVPPKRLLNSTDYTASYPRR
jgi:hypothetical protein